MLHGTLAEGGRTDDCCFVVISECGGEKLCCGSGIAVHQHCHGSVHAACSGIACEHDIACGILDADNRSFGEEIVKHCADYFKVAAGITAHIENIAFCTLCLCFLHAGNKVSRNISRKLGYLYKGDIAFQPVHENVS